MTETRRSFFVFFLCVSLFCFSFACRSDGENTLKLKFVTLVEKPEEMPSGLPREFRYPRSTMELLGFYDAGNFFTAQEGVIVFNTPDGRDMVEEYYKQVFRENEWIIIQNTEQAGGRLILAESPYQKLAAVILRGEDPLRIKLYFKRVSSGL